MLEDDDTEAAEIIEELKKQLKGSEVEQKLVLIEEAVAEYDFEGALENLVKWTNFLMSDPFLDTSAYTARQRVSLTLMRNAWVRNRIGFPFQYSMPSE